MARARRFQFIMLVGAATVLLAAGATALAQTSGDIVVEAPQVVHETIGRSSNGARDELVSLSHRITYTDLDLTKTADLAKLRTRVRDAATLGCEQLRKIYPLAPHDPDCVKKAVAKAMPQVRAAMGGH